MGLDRNYQTYEELSRFRAALDISGDAVYLVDRATMRFVDVNQTACTRMGYSREELLQMGPQDLLTSRREEIERLYDQVIAAGAGGMTMESSARTKDGRLSITELHRRAMRTDDGWIIVSIARDITRRKQAEQALHESEQQLRLFADSVPIMSSYWDERRICRLSSRLFAEFHGFTSDSIIGKHALDVFGDEVFARIEHNVERAMKGEAVSYLNSRTLASGETRSFEIRLLPNNDADGRTLGCFAIMIDITEHKQSEERIQRMAHHDSLTGLPNRLLFSDRLQQAIDRARRGSQQFALLYLDLDSFKPVNDTHGHAIGDELLKEVAARIRGQVRQSDTVARLGGDEFSVILPDLGQRQQAEAVAAKIMDAVAAPFELGAQKLFAWIGTSVGIAIYPADGGDADALVKSADADMYRAKERRK
jgi:diguanylate cyclase (GGDEF)-like protein/PAS domain S-box-containing protein